MNTELGEPDWVNWTAKTWQILEAQEWAEEAGCQLNDEACELSLALDKSREEWREHHEYAQLIEEIAYELHSIRHRLARAGIVPRPDDNRKQSGGQAIRTDHGS